MTEILSDRRGPSASLTLTARLNTSALDSRRGVVRLHPEAIAALGIKTSLTAMARIGIGPVMLLITETVFVLLLVVGLIYGLRTVGI